MEIGRGGRSCAGQRSSVIAMLGLLAAGAAVYLAFPPGILEIDSVIYASRAIHGDISAVLRAPHMGFDLMEYGAARIGQRLSPPASPIIIMARVSLVFGIAGILLLWHLLQRLGATMRTNLLVSGSLMFSYTYWHFSLQAEPHVIAGFLLIVVALQTYRLLQRPSTGRVLATSLALSAATLMHQTSILLLPAIVAGIAALRIDGRDRRKLAYTLVVSYAVVIAVPFLLAGIWATKGISARHLWHWITSSQFQSRWGQWRLTTIPAGAIGVTRSFVGSHYLLGFGPVERLAQRLFPLASLQDELRVASLVGGYIRAVLVPLQALLLVLYSLAAVRTVRNLKSVPATLAPYTVFLITWALVFTVFVIWWAPERAEFWIAVLIPGLILLGLPGPDRITSGISLPAVILVLVALSASNLLGSIRPQSMEGAEPETLIAVAVDAFVGQGDVVLSDCSFCGRASRYVRSFEKVNLLHDVFPEERAAARMPSGKAGHRGEQGGSAATGIAQEFIPLAMSRIDSILQAAEKGGSAVYIVMQPLSEDPDSRQEYAVILSAAQEVFPMSGDIPLRAQVELRKVDSR